MINTEGTDGSILDRNL